MSSSLERVDENQGKEQGGGGERKSGFLTKESTTKRHKSSDRLVTESTESTESAQIRTRVCVHRICDFFFNNWDRHAWNLPLIKLTDFGLAQKVELAVEEEGFFGSPAYAAPEVWREYWRATTLPGPTVAALPTLLTPPTPPTPTYSKPLWGKLACAADIWSAGVCLYMMLFIQAPFDEKKMRSKHYRWSTPTVTNDTDLQDLFSKMFQVEPSERIELSQIYEHPWLVKNLRLLAKDKAPLGYEIVSQGIRSGVT